MPLIKKKKQAESEPAGKDFATAYGAQRSAKRTGFAMGGMAMGDDASGSIVETIMKRRKMADGGMVDDDNMETPARLSPYDEDNMEATLKEIYDSSEDQIGPEPMDSEGDSDEADEENQDDMISAIRRRMKK